MIQEIYCEEMPEEIREEISFLYKIGITAEELNYLITLKLNRKS